MFRQYVRVGSMVSVAMTSAVFEADDGDAGVVGEGEDEGAAVFCADVILITATRAFDMPPTVTHVPTHQGPINCDLCREPRHPILRHFPLSAIARAGSGPGGGHA